MLAAGAFGALLGALGASLAVAPGPARRALRRRPSWCARLPCSGWRWARGSRAPADPARTPRRLVEAIHVGRRRWWRSSGCCQHLRLLPLPIPTISVPGSTFGNRNVAAEAVAMAIPFGLGLLPSGESSATGPAAARECRPPCRRPGAICLLALEIVYLAVARARGRLAGRRAGHRGLLRAPAPAPRPRAVAAASLAVGALALAGGGRSRAAGPRATRATPSGSSRPRASCTTPSIRPRRWRARGSGSGGGRWRSTARIRSPASAWETSRSLFPRYAEPNARADGVLSPAAVPRRAHNDLLERLAETRAARRWRRCWRSTPRSAPPPFAVPRARDADGRPDDAARAAAAPAAWPRSLAAA